MANSISPRGTAGPFGAGLVATGRRRLALGGIIVAIIAAPLSMVAMADGTASAVVEKGKDFIAMMKDRSPGERTTAELTKLKKMKAAERVLPRQRALAKVVKPAPPKEFLEALAPQLAELPPALLAPPFVPSEAIPPIVTGPPSIVPPGPPGGPITFPPGNPPTINPPPPPPEVPAVPEPSTWLSMLLGFGLLGSVLRYRRRTLAQA